MGFIFSGGKNYEAPKAASTERVANVKSSRVPTNEMAKPVPWAFGLQTLTGTYLSPIWGNWSEAITQTTSGGGKGGGSVTTTTGYNYFGSIAMALCIGPVTRLTTIYIGNDYLWQGDLTPASADSNGCTSITTTDGVILFYWGTDNQQVCSVMENGMGQAMPAYRHLCYIVMQDFSFGENTTPPTLRFEVEIKPQGLGQELIDRDADVASVVWEILTNKVAGCALDEAVHNKDTFLALAAWLRDNGMGVSPVYTQTDTVRQLCSDLFEYANCALVYRNNKIACIFADDSVTPTDVIDIEEGNITNEPVVDLGGYLDTYNKIQVTFADRESESNDDSEPFVDPANIAAQGRVVLKVFNRTFVTKRETANKMAGILGRQISMPLASLELRLKSTTTGIEPGSVINLIYPKLGFDKFYFRVSEIEIGGPDDPGIKITAKEDISRVKSVTPLEGGTPHVFDPLSTLLPTTKNDSVSLTQTDKGVVPAYFRIGCLTSDLLNEELNGLLDGFLACVRRPHSGIAGAAIYFGSSISGPWHLMKSINVFPIAARIDAIVSIDVVNHKCFLTVTALTDNDHSRLAAFQNSIEDIYLVCNRILVRNVAPILQEDVTPLLFKLTYQGQFDLVGTRKWTLECDMGQYGTTELGGTLDEGVSEYLAQDAFIGLSSAFGLTANNNIKFARDGENFTGDTELRRYVRVTTYTKKAFLAVEQSDMVFLDRNDTTMNALGSFGVLNPDGTTNTADNGWWGAAVVNDYQILQITSLALGYWRMNEASGNLIDVMLAQDLGVLGGVTRQVSGALVGDSDTALNFGGVDGYAVGSYAEATIPNAVRTVALWFKRTPMADIPSGRETIIEVTGVWGLYLEYGVLKAYRPSDPLFDIDTGITLDDGAYHHIVFTFGGDDDAKLYIDGELVAIDEFDFSATTETRLQIGARKLTPASSLDQALKASLDEVSILGRRLSWDEIIRFRDIGLGAAA